MQGIGGDLLLREINGVRINYSSSNSCHEAIDPLKCSGCRKQVQHVLVLFSDTNKKDVKFACNQCFIKMFSEMFATYGGDYVWACRLDDIYYKTRKEVKKQVRAKMTPKLRYKIMKRDNFQCVLCGRKPPEVQLCVDHIRPVAKGGDNSESNLRTLCYECNLGKGAD